MEVIHGRCIYEPVYEHFLCWQLTLMGKGLTLIGAEM